MRAAPPVSVHCTGGLPWRWVQAVVPALAAGASLAWLLGRAEQPLAWVAVVVLPVGLLAWRWSAVQPVALVWDGQRWTANGVAGRLDVMIDLGPWLLLRLRLQPESRSAVRWLALTAGEAGPALHGLRAAAYARPPDAKPRAAPLQQAAD